MLKDVGVKVSVLWNRRKKREVEKLCRANLLAHEQQGKWKSHYPGFSQLLVK